ncbi:MAG: cob(I)yrinic acid a,c-diamide adenosyltransferase [Flavobacteriales bacterium]|jgi:cob(I)alamin adenosyltransferase|nr:cob(I)yrinic acid a,c-diamide adenosyltransferase [Flavobacteriales bacterium]
MKIYTRTGDKGSTALLGGTRVPKDHLRIETYGTVDELNSHLGMLRDLAAPHHRERLVELQEVLFAIGSRLASSSEEEAERFKVPQVQEADVAALESWMDAMDKELPPMRNFILPGGHPAVSQAHICRTVCRRAERRVVQLAAVEPVPEVVVRFLNRLSDLFFVLARDLGRVLGVPDTPWKPRG